MEQFLVKIKFSIEKADVNWSKYDFPFRRYLLHYWNHTNSCRYICKSAMMKYHRLLSKSISTSQQRLSPLPSFRIKISYDCSCKIFIIKAECYMLVSARRLSRFLYSWMNALIWMVKAPIAAHVFETKCNVIYFSLFRDVFTFDKRGAERGGIKATHQDICYDKKHVIQIAETVIIWFGWTSKWRHLPIDAMQICENPTPTWKLWSLKHIVGLLRRACICNLFKD